MIYFAVFLAVFIIIVFLEIAKHHHFFYLRKHENKYKSFELCNFINNEQSFSDKKIINCFLVTGEIVVCTNFFQYIFDYCICIIFGKIFSIEESYDYARREAVLKMEKNAKILSADTIINVKYSVVNLSPSAIISPPQIAVLAYGTALTFEK